MATPNAPATVGDIMTKKVVSVTPEMPLAKVAEMLNTYKLNGFPVVDENNVLVGIVTEYDLISGESGIHLPTLQSVLSQLPVLHKDKSEFKEDIADISKLTVKDVMNSDPLTLNETATFTEAVTAFKEHHRVNPIPVIDASKHVVGVVSRFDVLRPLQALLAQ